MTLSLTLTPRSSPGNEVEGVAAQPHYRHWLCLFFTKLAQIIDQNTNWVYIFYLLQKQLYKVTLGFGISRYPTASGHGLWLCLAILIKLHIVLFFFSIIVSKRFWKSKLFMCFFIREFLSYCCWNQEDSYHHSIGAVLNGHLYIYLHVTVLTLNLYQTIDHEKPVTKLN